MKLIIDIPNYDLDNVQFGSIASRMIFKAVKKGIPLEQEPKTGHWTPVSEGLPEENKTVIASSEYGVYPEARYTKENGWEWAYETLTDYYWAELANVTAWMPLPKPYKEESEKE